MEKYRLAAVDVSTESGRPRCAEAFLVEKVREEIGDLVDVEKHFTPRYNPGISAFASYLMTIYFVRFKLAKPRW